LIEWSGISKRISYFTYEMKDFVPDSSGFYAWYFPLWLYDADLIEYIAKVSKVFSYEERADKDGYVNILHDLNWSSLDLKIKLQGHQINPCSDSLVDDWNEAMSSDEAKSVLEEAMMTASIIMPPLYVGKADNLRSRYEQHTTDSSFKRRFDDFMHENKINISVSELIFCAVRLDPDTNVKMKTRKLNELVEQVVMRMAAPPYSKQ
jgi:hypothetical protein